MSRKLSDFPSLCLFRIFRYIQLKDLISNVGQVCSSWNDIQVSELTYRRSKLVLMQGRCFRCEAQLLFLEQKPQLCSHLMVHVLRDEDGKPWTSIETLKELFFNSLPIIDDVLSSDFITPMAYSLSNITDLTLFQIQLSNESAPQALIQMSRLLSHWSDKLVHLKLYFSYEAALLGTIYNEDEVKGNIEQNFDVLVHSLNQMTQLKTLHLKVTLNHLELKNELKILSRLELFTIGDVQNSDWLISSINNHAGSDIQIYYNDFISFTNLGHLNQEANLKFIHFYLSERLIVEDFEEFRNFGMRFTSLTSLSLHDSKMPMTMLLRCLSSCEKLVYLKLQIDSIREEVEPKKKEIEEGEEEVLLWNQEPEEDEPFVIVVPKLYSIRMVTLQFTTRSHFDTSLLCFPESFPNLQMLELYHSIAHCTDCKITPQQVTAALAKRDNSESAFVYRIQIEKCLAQAREPFRACALLRKVFLNNMNTFEPSGLMDPDEM